MSVRRSTLRKLGGYVNTIANGRGRCQRRVVMAAWRYLDYNFKSGNKIESLNFNGPAIGVAFRW